MRSLVIEAINLIPIEEVPRLYSVLGPDQKKVWDQAEDDLEAAGRNPDAMLFTLACERYILVMSEVLRFAERKIQHALIAQRLREDCWSAREES